MKELYIEIELIFKQIEKILQKYSKIQKGKQFWKFLYLPLFIIIMLLWLLSSNLSIFLQTNLRWETLGILLLFTVLIFSAFIWWLFWKNYILVINFFKILNPHLELLKRINNEKIFQSNDLEKILEKTELIYASLLDMQKWQFLMKFLFFIPQLSLRLKILWKKEIELFILILADTQSNLSIRLTEQQQTLESAKSEVEKNIVWSTELNQVSELQQARLDRQIEQFKELQRALVKV